MAAYPREIGSVRVPAAPLFPSIGQRLGVPLRVDTRLHGRLELFLGRPGEGKTSGGFLRARQIARAKKTGVATNCGGKLPEGWRRVDSWDSIMSCESEVLFLDELHLLIPGAVMAGVATKADVEQGLVLLTYLRKMHIDIVGTTQSLSRVPPAVRQTCTMVWPVERVRHGLHRAWPLDPPLDGGRMVSSPHYFSPEWSLLDTDARAWSPQL